MTVQQFEDKNLSHFSYAISSAGEIAIIDPGRDPLPYLTYAASRGETIKYILETHPHADFVSGHAELAEKSKAIIGCSYLTGAKYAHASLHDQDEVKFGMTRFLTLETPGHSPDSLCFLLYDETNRPYCLFTGDTLFIGDVGRPDLRENTGNTSASKEDLTAALFKSLKTKILTLNDEILVYPAHGAGTLCGKAMRDASSSSIGMEKKTNPALQFNTIQGFSDYLLAEQPFIPAYFPFDVELNKEGAPYLENSLQNIPLLNKNDLSLSVQIIDTRSASEFRLGHLPGAYNLQAGLKFETWLGSVILPHEEFILLGHSQNELAEFIYRAAKIGYEAQIKGTLLSSLLDGFDVLSPESDYSLFKAYPERFTIIDVRNESETREGKIFDNARLIPLSELRQRITEIPAGKPVMVHCQGGYRSALAASILQANLKVEVFDLGERILDYKQPSSIH